MNWPLCVLPKVLLLPIPLDRLLAPLRLLRLELLIPIPLEPLMPELLMPIDVPPVPKLRWPNAPLVEVPCPEASNTNPRDNINAKAMNFDFIFTPANPV